MYFSRCLIALPFVFASQSAWAESPMSGAWKVVEANVAPWVDGKSAKPEIDPKIANAKLIFTENSVQGPHPLGCAKAKFTVSAVGAEYLFQGGLKNPKPDAAALGFKVEKITSVNESCLRTDADVEMDFALIDQDTAVFGLDNVIYKMKRLPR